TLFRSFNPRLLDPDKQARLKEYMSVPEMQVRQPQLVRGDGPPPAPPTGTPPEGDGTPGQDGAGRATATDSRPADYAKQGAAMQHVRFEARGAEGMDAQRQAMERFRAGDMQGAIDVLTDFAAKLTLSTDARNGGLDPDRLSLLRRPVENRLQQYKTLAAQKRF